MSFDIVPPLLHVAAEAKRKNWVDAFAMYQHPLGYEVRDLTITDLSIMDALADDPKVPFGEILKTTGLSPKTVRKHLNRLLETKTISVDPILGALTDSGELIYPLLIAGRVSIDGVRKIMAKTTQIRHTRASDEICALQSKLLV
ncbi:MAG: winged helix-turn-helix transcriptional regulator [Nitrososphaera sp.]